LWRIPSTDHRMATASDELSLGAMLRAINGGKSRFVVPERDILTNLEENAAILTDHSASAQKMSGEIVLRLADVNDLMQSLNTAFGDGSKPEEEKNLSRSTTRPASPVPLALQSDANLVTPQRIQKVAAEAMERKIARR